MSDWDLVTSSGEITDYDQLNTPRRLRWLLPMRNAF